MCDEWMPDVRFPLPADMFLRLPRNAAYAYDYADGAAHLSPRPRTFHARLELGRFQPTAAELAADGRYGVERVEERDLEFLAPLFADAFECVQPFAGLDVVERQEAARASLKRVSLGGDGPWVSDASFRVIWKENQRSAGALLTTLLPAGDPKEPQAYEWLAKPPGDLWARGGGVPHLTWIFVAPFHKGHGVGTTLLQHAVTVLRSRGYTYLLTTFLAGNESSLLWHWRNGFELLPYIVSKRSMRARGLLQ